MQKVPVTVAVITKNEENKIAKCLESLKWADEIIVLDDESLDKTVEIAKRYTDRVVTKKMEVEGKHRNYAYSLARNNWVLSLDADEVVSDGLRAELTELFKTEPKDAAITIPIKTFIGDYWIRYGGWYPASKVRLFRNLSRIDTQHQSRKHQRLVRNSITLFKLFVVCQDRIVNSLLLES